MPPNSRQIKLIHTLKGALQFDDETYLAVLGGYGVTTSTKLSITKADQLIADLTEKALAAGVWKGKGNGELRMKNEELNSKFSIPNSQLRLGDDPQARKIKAQWWHLHKIGAVNFNTDQAILAFVKRTVRKDALIWCSSHEKGRVIDALKQWIEDVEAGNRCKTN